MSGKVFLLFLLLGAVYLEAQAQPGAGGEYAYIHATCTVLAWKHYYNVSTEKVIDSSGNFCAGDCFLGLNCQLGFFPAASFEDCCMSDGVSYRQAGTNVCQNW